MVEDFEYYLDDIEVCECVGEFDDDYVYDIEMEDETHTFIANDVLVHNSVFVSFKHAINRYKWSHKEIELVLHMSKITMQPFFKRELEKYASKYNVDNRQDFELEQIAKSTINIKKKMYIKNIVWEEGVFNEPETNIQAKGIDLVRSSTPAFIRDKEIGIPKIIKYFFENPTTMNDKELSRMMREMKEKFKLANIEDISKSTSCNNYKKFIIDDQECFRYASKTPHGVKSAALHNYILNQSPEYKKRYELIKSGSKIRIYYTKNTLNNQFAYMAGAYPKELALKYAPIDYDKQFEKCALDFLNRFTKVLRLSELTPSLTFRLSIF
jgi:hypothetical protein